MKLPHGSVREMSNVIVVRKVGKRPFEAVVPAAHAHLPLERHSEQRKHCQNRQPRCKLRPKFDDSGPLETIDQTRGGCMNRCLERLTYVSRYESRLHRAPVSIVLHAFRR